MVADNMPMREVLELALGDPDESCVNLRMLYAFMKQLMQHAGADNVLVNLKNFTGIRDGGVDQRGANAMFQAGIDTGANPGDVIMDLWEYIKLKKQVEANKKGIDTLFEMAGGIIDQVGDGHVLTWEALGDTMHDFDRGGTEAHLKKAVDGLERAKAYVRDPERQDRLERRKTRILEKFNGIQEARRSTLMRRSQPSGGGGGEADERNKEVRGGGGGEQDGGRGGGGEKSKKSTGFKEEERSTPAEKKGGDPKSRKTTEDFRSEGAKSVGGQSEVGRSVGGQSVGGQSEGGQSARLDLDSDSAERSTVSSTPPSTVEEVQEPVDPVKKSVNILGKVALFHGANEARLNAIDEQLKNLLKFKKTITYMMQDLDIQAINDKIGLLNPSDVKTLNDLLKQIAGGDGAGLESLQKLIQSLNGEGVAEQLKMNEMAEKMFGLEQAALMGQLAGFDGADGAFGGAGAAGAEAKAAMLQAKTNAALTAQAKKMGAMGRKMDRMAGELKAAKAEMKRMMDLVADLMNEVNQIREMESKMNELKELSMKLQEELARQNELLMSIADAFSEYGSAIELLKKQVKHLQDYKADKSWVKKELALKADLALLDNYVTKDDFDDVLEEMNRSLGELQDQQSSMERLFDSEMKRLNEELASKTSLDSFEAFKKGVSDGLDQLRRRLEWIAGVASGEEDAACLKINKFHCISCDRPIHMLGGQKPAPTIPAPDGVNVSKSANPYLSYEKSKVRKAVNSSFNNRGPLPDPQRVGPYAKAVEDKENLWKKRRDFCLDRKYAIPDPVLANRKDIYDINTESYYRVVAPGESEDVWKQPRKCGGESTTTKTFQKTLVDGGGGGAVPPRRLPKLEHVEKEIIPDVSKNYSTNRSERPVPRLHRDRLDDPFRAQWRNVASHQQPPSSAASSSSYEDPVAVAAVPAGVIDLNLDLRGKSNIFYIGDPGDISGLGIGGGYYAAEKASAAAAAAAAAELAAAEEAAVEAVPVEARSEPEMMEEAPQKMEETPPHASPPVASVEEGEMTPPTVEPPQLPHAVPPPPAISIEAPAAAEGGEVEREAEDLPINSQPSPEPPDN